MAELTYANVAAELGLAIPEFQPTIKDHTETHGEVLQHVLFGDLSRFVEDAELAGQTELVDRCLRFLEGAIRADDDLLENLVAVSFIENLVPDPEARSIMARFPRRLRSELLLGWADGMLETAIDNILIIGLEGRVNLWRVDEQAGRLADRSDRRDRILRIIQPLLEAELAEVGDVLEEVGFVRWDCDAAQSLDRIRSETPATGVPPDSASICWLALTPAGKAKGHEVISCRNAGS